MITKGAFVILLLHTIFHGNSQISSFDYNPYLFHTLDRIYGNHPKQFTAHSAIRYNDPLFYLDLLDSSSMYSNSDQIELVKIIRQYNELHALLDSSVISESPQGLGLWNTFYKTTDHMISISTSDLELRVNPMLSISGGKQDGNSIYQNTRGIKIRGSIDHKIYFYSAIYENQREFLGFVNQRIARWGAIPGQGFYKPYQSKTFSSFTGWDYLNAQAYTGFKISKSVDLQLGYGNHFIGDGYRSMLLSDYSHNYLYLKLNTQIWKFHYQNLFTELAPISSTQNEGDNLLPKKYMVAHFLDFKASSRLSIGLYEAVVFSRNNQFELQYLNPVILYRSIEQFLDSPDNVLIGLNVSYIPINGTKVYGQLMMDEFRTDQLFSGAGWWGNKIAYQIGLEQFDILSIDRLDLQLEYNTARPYTYSHRVADSAGNVLTSYSHFNQSLAHPLGANFREMMVLLRYQPHTDWLIYGRFIHTNYGDSWIDNVGFDLLLNNETRVDNFGNVTGQGIPVDVTLLELSLSYEVLPGYFFDLRYLHRDQTSEDTTLSDQTSYISLGLRTNMFNKVIDY